MTYGFENEAPEGASQCFIGRRSMARQHPEGEYPREAPKLGAVVPAAGHLAIGQEAGRLEADLEGAHRAAALPAVASRLRSLAAPLVAIRQRPEGEADSEAGRPADLAIAVAPAEAQRRLASRRPQAVARCQMLAIRPCSEAEHPGIAD